VPASYYAGEVLSILIDDFVSPAVLGMMILFLLLKSGIVKREWVEGAASFLLDNLMLFFIPVTAGVALVPFNSLKAEFPAIVLSVVVSSFVVLWVASSIVQKFDSGKNDEY
jgi:holin-like protein